MPEIRLSKGIEWFFIGLFVSSYSSRAIVAVQAQRVGVAGVRNTETLKR
jgi:hypothetical protein